MIKLITKYYLNLNSTIFQIVILFALLIFLSVPALKAQSSSNIDSARIIYESGEFVGEDLLPVLRILAEYSDVPDKLQFSNELIELASKYDSPEYLYIGYLQKGNSYLLISELVPALENLFEAGRIAEAENMSIKAGRASIAIADVYSVRDDHTNAIRYYNRAISQLKNENDSLGIATAYENMGDEYLTVGEPDSALKCFEKSGKIFKAYNFEDGIAYNNGNRGIALAMMGLNDSAKVMLNKAITQLELMEDYYPIPIYLSYMSDVYMNQGNEVVAINYSKQSLDIAKKYGLTDQISDVNLKLSELYEQTGDYKNSLEHYKQYKEFRDSVNDQASIQEMANLRTDFEINKKQMEVDLLNQQKENQRIIFIAVVVALFLMIVIAVGLFRRNKFIAHTKKIIEREKGRSDDLLLNILPSEIAEELKESGKVKARRFEEVSVLFADFIGFTKHSESLSPEQLVNTVDYYFSKFDEIIEKNGLEKVKTIGDAYMCAAGLPFPDEDHALKVTRAAFEMAEFVDQSKIIENNEIIHFDVRIGISSGPVVAGVVGTKKFAYDIWGDTVNIASRMESNSQPGKINVSEYTCKLISNHYNCVSRGEIDVKNKGKMKMYFVEPTTTIASKETEKSKIRESNY
ncbi:tetratricopeptide repeat protein [Mangrovivirga sp. M17]|uniref:Tetratricopeptide repeat protein n=1 Tax=Mangrovivirga halotolerans TaxID=2993936 RepID=A0ABT3RU94_9BACT|nr:adenylate/guanylate cyclase domain-containing protein [Mangrovivirga halotolerans]MCX2745349.1 tetratricopeptide repeat protein [Mangrovivirga halotolerans]